jgi:hypothetical protein
MLFSLAAGALIVSIAPPHGHRETGRFSGGEQRLATYLETSRQ